MEDKSSPAVYQPGTFGYDLKFLNDHQKTIVLKRDEAMLASIDFLCELVRPKWLITL